MPRPHARPRRGGARVIATWALVCAITLPLLAGQAMAEKAGGAEEPKFRLPDSICPELAGNDLPPLALPEPWANLRDTFLKARCLEQAGESEQAVGLYTKGLNATERFKQPWLNRLAHLQKAMGNHKEALAHYEALLANRPGLEYLRQARAMALDWSDPTSKLSDEMRTRALDAYLEQAPEYAADARLVERRLELAIAAKDEKRAQWARLRLWRVPKNTNAAKAIAYPGSKGSTPEPVQQLARYRRLYGLRMYSQLINEVEQTPFGKVDPATAKSIGRLYFRSLIRMRHLKKAAVQAHMPPVLEKFHFSRAQQLVWASRVQLLREWVGPALKYVAELEKSNPRHPALADLYLDIYKYNRGRKNEVTAEYWFDKLTKTFPGTEEAADAYWLRFRDLRTWGRNGDSAELLHNAMRQKPALHAVDQARMMYWHAGSLMATKEQDKAMELLENLRSRWPYGYYSFLAEWRMDGGPQLKIVDHPAKDPPQRPKPQPDLAKLWKFQPLADAIFLFTIGEREEAERRMKPALGRAFPRELLEDAEALFEYLHTHHLQQRLISNYRLNTLRVSEIENNPLWRRAFPRAYWELVSKESRAAGIDPLFALSIMREESRFNHNAESIAGAKGLMQVMPATARMVARRHGMPYEEEKLLDPEFNIPVGVRFLGRLSERFDSNPVWVAAAYNAGPGNMNKWMRRYGNLPMDDFIERIPFKETRLYVKRVLLSYDAYNRLYREKGNSTATGDARPAQPAGG